LDVDVTLLWTMLQMKVHGHCMQLQGICKVWFQAICTYSWLL